MRTGPKIRQFLTEAIRPEIKGRYVDTFHVATRGLDVIAFDRVIGKECVKAIDLVRWFISSDEGHVHFYWSQVLTSSSMLASRQIIRIANGLNKTPGLAPLPPSSSATRLSDSAAAFDMAMPARVDPVKLIMSTWGWVGSRVSLVHPCEHIVHAF
jgi:hypothetical protein